MTIRSKTFFKISNLTGERRAKTPKPLIYQEDKRRGGDSNPRAPLRTTRFPSVRTKPLCDLSITKEVNTVSTSLCYHILKQNTTRNLPQLGK